LKAQLKLVDRIELYTEGYAKEFEKSKFQTPESKAILSAYVQSAKRAKELGLGINAGHDLDLHNLQFLKKNIPWLAEVSIGHALISDALYLGLENTVQLYKRQIT